jgi:hypothetical protein
MRLFYLLSPVRLGRAQRPGPRAAAPTGAGVAIPPPQPGNQPPLTSFSFTSAHFRPPVPSIPAPQRGHQAPAEKAPAEEAPAEEGMPCCSRHAREAHASCYRGVR